MGMSPAEPNLNDDTDPPFFFIERFACSHHDIDGLIAYALFKWDKKEEIAIQESDVAKPAKDVIQSEKTID